MAQHPSMGGGFQVYIIYISYLPCFPTEDLGEMTCSICFKCAMAKKKHGRSRSPLILG